MSRPFRLVAPEPLEQELHESCVRALDALLAPPAFWFCYPAGFIKLSPQQVAKLKRSGLKRGLPDFWLVYSGLVFCLELKRIGGRLSKSYIGRTRHGAVRLYEGQEDVFPKLRDAGAAIAVVHSMDEMLTQIRRWGIPLRNRPGGG